MALRFSGSQQREFLIFHIFWYAQTIQRKYHKYKADKVLYCNNGKYRFVNVIVGNFVSSFHLDDIVEFEAVDLVVVKQVNKKEK